MEAIKECGTPVKLLVAYYERLNEKLILMNGSRCHRVWEPEGWHEREREQKIAVVLNVWSNHVSAYRSDVGDMHPEEKKKGFFNMWTLTESIYWGKANIGNPLNLLDD